MAKAGDTSDTITGVAKTPATPAAPAPPTATAMCDCGGCGMPAVEVTSKLNHCEHHRSWVDTKDANIVRAQKGL